MRCQEYCENLRDLEVEYESVDDVSRPETAKERLDGWARYEDAQNQVYWHNIKTGESSWQAPETVVAVRIETPW